MADESSIQNNRLQSQLIGKWWMPAIALSLGGLYLAMQFSSPEGAGRESFFNVAHPWSVYVFMASLVSLLSSKILSLFYSP